MRSMVLPGARSVMAISRFLPWVDAVARARRGRTAATQPGRPGQPIPYRTGLRAPGEDASGESPSGRAAVGWTLRLAPSEPVWRGVQVTGVAEEDSDPSPYGLRGGQAEGPAHRGPCLLPSGHELL